MYDLTKGDVAHDATGGEPRSSVAFILSGEARHRETPEVWVRASVTSGRRIRGAEGYLYELEDCGETGRAAGSLQAALGAASIAALSREHETAIPWDELAGGVLDLKLRVATSSHGGDVADIVGIEPAWVRTQVSSILADRRRVLAMLGLLDRQRSSVRTVRPTCVRVVRAASDPTWPDIERELQRVRAQDLAIDVSPFDFNDTLGTGRLGRNLEVLIRPAVLAPCCILIVSGQAPFRLVESYDAAAIVAQAAPPVLVGMPRGRYGSLLHEASFAATDTPKEAIDLLIELVAAWPDGGSASGSGSRGEGSS